MNPSTFLAAIKQGTIANHDVYKILPSVSAAQAILESNWGKSRLAKECYNLFGIKADSGWKGEQKAYATKEYDSNGNLYTVTAYFRKYASYEESLKDHGKFFHENQRYTNVLGLEEYKAQAKAIQAAGYATDPQYANKLIQLIEESNLQQWDREVVTQASSTRLNNKGMHRVKSGEILSAIAKKYGVSIQALVSANRVTNPNLIYPNQEIIIPSSQKPFYIVKKGDTLTSIAQQFGTTVQQLAEKNFISDINPIEIGQKLLID